jgi:hypothetical protein
MQPKTYPQTKYPEANRFVPGRRKYCRRKVQDMRAEMATRKSGREGISDSQYQAILGKLQAAGHLKIEGLKSFNVTKEVFEPMALLPESGGGSVDKYTISFQSSMGENMKGNRPHLRGYLTSASDKDKEYKLKGWFNEDGTVRLLITN